jgi:hypothetical protein
LARGIRAIALAGIRSFLLSELGAQVARRRARTCPRARRSRGSSRRLRELVRDEPMRELAIAAFLYAALQVCLVSFIVVYLTGIAALLARRSGPRAHGGERRRSSSGASRGAASLISTSHRACCWDGSASPPAPVRSRPPASPRLADRAAILVTSAVFGATAIGWNGVMLSEVARLAPTNRVGAITGAFGFVTFGGVMARAADLRPDRRADRQLSVRIRDVRQPRRRFWCMVAGPSQKVSADGVAALLATAIRSCLTRRQEAATA